MSSSAPLTPLLEERLEQSTRTPNSEILFLFSYIYSDLADAREQLSEAEKKLEKTRNAHEKAVKSSKMKKGVFLIYTSYNMSDRILFQPVKKCIAWRMNLHNRCISGLWLRFTLPR
jgi:hypothetical protein